jgi:hypothetical protein
MEMTEKAFWRIIARFDWKKSGDDKAVLGPACSALAKLPVEAIVAFDDMLSEKLHALDTRAHCEACYAGQQDPDNGDDYISADDFLYSRCVVVANGRGLYESVLETPAEMPQEMEFESLLYLAANAFEEKTGDSYEHVTPVDHESFQNEAGWAATSSTKPGRFTGAGVPPGNRRPT